MAVAAGMHVSVVPLPGGTDPADLVRENPDRLKDLLSKDKPFVDYALTLVRDGYADRRQREKAIREYLYPTLADTYNEIEKDRALQDIALLLGVAPDATRRDFEKWRTAGSSSTPISNDEKIVAVKSVNTQSKRQNEKMK